MWRDKRKRIGDFVLVGMLLGLLSIPFALRREEEKAQLSSGDEKLVVLSSHWEGARYEFGQAFRRHCAQTLGRSVTVEWLDVGGTADTVKFISSEFARNPATIGVDVVFGGGVEAHMQLAKRGYLAPVSLTDELRREIPEMLSGMRIYDARRRWFGAALSGFGILYNVPILRRLGLPTPQKWEDLAKPEMLTWVGSGDPRSSGSTHMVYEIILQAYGWKKGFSVVLRMGANIRSFSRSSADVPRDTSLGEVACGMALDSYAWNQMERVGRHRLGYVLPPRLTVINPDAVAMLKGAPHGKLAEEFIHFVLSRKGQALWMLPPKKKLSVPKSSAPDSQHETLEGPRRFALTRMSVRRDLHRLLKGNSPVEMDPFSWEGSFPYDDKKASKRWDIINALLGAAILDNHHRLQTAWRRLIQSGTPRDVLRRLTKPPMTERELMNMAQRWSEDAAYRSRMRVRWAKLFRARYEKIASSLARPSRWGCSR